MEEYTANPTGFGFNNGDEHFKGVAKEINQNLMNEYDSVRHSTDKREIKQLKEDALMNSKSK